MPVLLPATQGQRALLEMTHLFEHSVLRILEIYDLYGP